VLAAPNPHVLLCTDPAAEGDVRALLVRAGYRVTDHGLDAPLPEDLPAFDLIVIEGSERPLPAQQLCRRLRPRLADAFAPILFITADVSPAARLLSLESGADAYLLRPFNPEELLAQAQAFLRLKRIHDRLTEKTAEAQLVNKRLQQAYQQINDELELARRIQRSFLPQTLPDMPPVRFAVCYRPCGRVGGDFYDVFRLDENHLGFYVADAMGHGVPASLLTIFVKKGVRAKEIFGQQYRLLPPDEVLQRLNRDLIDQALSDQPFISMVYGLFDCRARTLRYARAGHPYPLYLPHEGEPQFWQGDGTLLGLFDTKFAAQSRQLRAGDKVLLYTDGVEPGRQERAVNGVERLVRAAECHRALPVGEFIDQVARELLGGDRTQDDFTLLGLEVEGGEAGANRPVPPSGAPVQ
jgi:sigma-B regulation protein RsbU (phosphoserine phosphatase)